MFYPYNEGKKLCFLGKLPAPFIFDKCLGKQKIVGNHVGDFEHIAFSFDKDLTPRELFLSLHDVGVYYTYDASSKIFKNSRYLQRKGILQTTEFPPFVRTFEGRPILFAAKGSHGLWSAPGKYYYLKLPKLADINDYGTPWKTWKHLQIYREGYNKPPVWMRYLGRWGNPKTNCFLFSKIGLCEISDGPYGISQRESDFQCWISCNWWWELLYNRIIALQTLWSFILSNQNLKSLLCVVCVPIELPLQLLLCNFSPGFL